MGEPQQTYNISRIQQWWCVLPLKDEEGKAVFDREEKCALLEKVFFAGKHLDDC